MNPGCLVMVLSGAALIAAAASGQTVTFEVIPNAVSANDLSPDGRFITGEHDANGDGFADGTYVRDWETGQVIVLPPGGLLARAVSDDGMVVLGDMPNPEGDGAEVAGLWTAATGWQSLGYLPDALACPSRSNGYELSADGTVAVGLSWDGCNGRAFRWTGEAGMIELQVLGNGGNRASVVSADGSIIAGFAQGNAARTPAMWTADATGALLDPTANTIGEVHGISDDGSVLLVEWNLDAVKWTQKGGVALIGNGSLFPSWKGVPTDIADDGTIVGFDFNQGNRRAWIQPQGTGAMIDLKAWAIDHGAVVPGPLILEVSQAVSRDGRVIVGHGFGSGAWRITITPPTCAGDVDGNGLVDVEDLVAVIVAWGSDDPDADIDGSGSVDVSDLVAVITAWGSC